MTRSPVTVLMVFSKFGDSDDTRYLTNDLADAFAARGFAVRVIHLPWDSPPGTAERFYVQENGVEVLVSPPLNPGWLGKLGALFAKWGGSSFLAARRGRRRFGRSPADLVIGMSPVVIGAFIWRWALKAARMGSYAYLVDFFPFHHRAIGVMPGGAIFAAAHWLECRQLQGFTAVGCMSPLGLDYLKRNYSLRPDQATGILSLWGPRSLALPADPQVSRESHDLPGDRPIAVFGGQITHGRGIEDILACAGLAHRAGADILFLFIGRGPLAPLIQQTIEGGAPNVRLISELGRDEYLSVVAACDVGIVATVANVDVPTFPSKTIDYLRAGLPVAASVEASTDFDAFVEARGFGLAVTAGDPARLLAAIQSILADDDRRRAMVSAGRRTLEEIFNVDVAVTDILAQIAQARGANSATAGADGA